MPDWKNELKVEFLDLINSGWKVEEIAKKFNVHKSAIYHIINDTYIFSEYASKRHSNLRKQALNILGNICTVCGFSDTRALQIDHINGGGNQDRKTMGSRQTYTWIIKNSATAHEKYKILCANCNWIKKHENKETNSSYARKPRKFIK